MDVESFEMLWQAITPIQGEEMSLNIECTAFPHLKKESRKSIQKKVEKSCKIDFEEDTARPAVTTNELAKMLQRSLNG